MDRRCKSCLHLKFCTIYPCCRRCYFCCRAQNSRRNANALFRQHNPLRFARNAPLSAAFPLWKRAHFSRRGKSFSIFARERERIEGTRSLGYVYVHTLRVYEHVELWGPIKSLSHSLSLLTVSDAPHHATLPFV